MITVKKEIREEREDVYSFWEEKKVLNSNDEIIIEEIKIEECTIVELERRVSELEKTILSEQNKINLINSIKDA